MVPVGRLVLLRSSPKSELFGRCPFLRPACAEWGRCWPPAGGGGFIFTTFRGDGSSSSPCRFRSWVVVLTALLVPTCARPCAGRSFDFQQPDFFLSGCRVALSAWFSGWERRIRILPVWVVAVCWLSISSAVPLIFSFPGRTEHPSSTRPAEDRHHSGGGAGR